MPINTNCPNCKAVFRLGEEMAGKKVKCQKCQGIFVVPSAEAPPAEAGLSDMQLDDAPAKAESSSVTAKAPPPAPTDESAHDDSGKKKLPKPPPLKKDPDKKSAGSTRRRETASSGGSGMLIVGGLVVVLGLFACCGVGSVGGYFFWLRNKPVADHEPGPIAAANKAKDGGQDKKPIAKTDGIKADDKKINDKKVDGGKDPFFDPDKDKKKVIPAGGVITAVFGLNGVYVSDNVLTDRDPVRDFGRVYKIYAFQLEAGATYQFDMTSVVIDPHQFLLDDKGIEVAQNDDFTGLDSRIVYSPERSGTYRLQAANHRPGQTGPFNLTVRRLKGPDIIVKKDDPPPKKEDRNLVTRTTRTGPWEFKDLDIPAAGAIAALEITWDPLGKHFYYLHGGTTLNKVSREFTLLASLALGQQCKHLCYSADGLVVAPTSSPELWVIDPEKFEIRSKINVGMVPRWVAASPSSGNALLLNTNFVLVSLKDSKLLETPVIGAPGNFLGFKSSPVAPTMSPALSPDGKYLFTQASDYSLHRLRIDGNRLVHESAKSSPGKYLALFSISPDSKQMAIGYSTALSSAKVPNTDIYSIGNWDVPVMSMGARLRLLQFDAQGGIYGEVNKAIRYYPDPTKLFNESYTPSAPIRRLIVAPQGPGCMVILTSREATWMQTVGK